MTQNIETVWHATPIAERTPYTEAQDAQNAVREALLRINMARISAAHITDDHGRLGRVPAKLLHELDAIRMRLLVAETWADGALEQARIERDAKALAS